MSIIIGVVFMNLVCGICSIYIVLSKDNKAFREETGCSFDVATNRVKISWAWLIVGFIIGPIAVVTAGLSEHYPQKVIDEYLAEQEA